MRNKLMSADQILKNPQCIDGNYLGGFNSRVHGENYNDTVRGHPSNIGTRGAGWYKADMLIKLGVIYSVYPFPHNNCTDTAFPYGGTWVCNSCGQSRLEKPWWRIMVMQDGNAWCCVGEGFEDLQSSDNFEFGNTRDEAIKKYGIQMLLNESNGK